MGCPVKSPRRKHQNSCGKKPFGLLLVLKVVRQYALRQPLKAKKCFRQVSKLKLIIAAKSLYLVILTPNGIQ